jgi:DNA polymerase V
MALTIEGQAAAWEPLQPLPLFLCPVKAGFPSPADDFLEDAIDLNQQLVSHPSATYFLRVQGDSMKEAGIQSGDMLVVDASIEPRDGMIVIAAVDGQLTVKRLVRQRNRIFLVADNPEYPPIPIQEGNELNIWGVVKHCIRSY